MLFYIDMDKLIEQLGYTYWALEKTIAIHNKFNPAIWVYSGLPLFTFTNTGIYRVNNG